MCGIAGILRLDGRPVDRREIVSITRPLAHRGPDGEGIWADGSIGLGHRRLAILDVSERGAQPMACVAERYVITFNGEIFNFVELRQQLENYGQRFRSDTDTEVIAHAFHIWGDDCVSHFNGMWAFAIWDTRRRRLFASRDHFGIKPFHYRIEPNCRFTFASELKSFLHLSNFTPRENVEMTRRGLMDWRTVEMVDDTLIEGVQKLPAGHNLTIDERGLRIARWWNTIDNAPRVPDRFEDQVLQFRELFIDACKIRMRSDVSVGTCLSGGVDSTAILCTLAKLRNEGATSNVADRLAQDSHRAFVATYPGTAWDERNYAQIAIDHTDATPHFEQLDAELAVDQIRRYAYDFEAIGGTLVIQMSQIYNAMRRQGVVVSIDGQGADELLAGYAVHVEHAERSHDYRHEPLRRLSLLRTRYGMYGTRIPLRNTAREWLNQTRRNDNRVLDSSTLMRQPWMRQPWLEEPNDHLDTHERSMVAEMSPFDRMMYLGFHHHHLPNLLRNFDRLSMANGVESRMPFLDWRVVAYGFALPETSKLGGGQTKHILREAMKGIMPERIRTRRTKLGFTSPTPNWFRGALGDWIANEVSQPAFLQQDLWNGEAIRDYVRARNNAETWTLNDCERIWPYVQTHLWRESFFGDSALRNTA